MHQLYVHVRFLSRCEGGRKVLPTGSTYSCITEIPAVLGQWSVRFGSLTAGEYHQATLGTMQFLVEDAPLHRVQKGMTLELFEGARRVGTAEVLDFVAPLPSVSV